MQEGSEMDAQLDALLLEHLGFVSQFQVLMAELVKHLKNVRHLLHIASSTHPLHWICHTQGHWNMGKARYAMGGTSLTSHQYDMNMKASVFFPMESLEGYLSDEEEEGEGESLPEAEAGPGASETVEVKEKEGGGGEVTGDTSTGLRRRKPATQTQTTPENGETENAKDEGKERGQKGQDGREAGKPAAQKKEKMKDPLYWFGVLVPPALRQSQKDFKEGNLVAYHKLAF